MSFHKNILIRILKDIYTDSSLGPFLGFKGGTAAYFFLKSNWEINREIVEQRTKEMLGIDNL